MKRFALLLVFLGACATGQSAADWDREVHKMSAASNPMAGISPQQSPPAPRKPCELDWMNPHHQECVEQVKMQQNIERNAENLRRELEREADKPSQVEQIELAPGVLGYLVAIQEDHRSDAKAEIAKEQYYARQGGGIIDASAIHGFQEQMRDADEEIARLRQSAKDLGVKVAGRNDPRMVRAEDCISSDALTKERWCRVIRSLLSSWQ